MPDYSKLTCISKNGGSWTSKHCEYQMMYDINNSTLGMKCTCKYPDVITLVDDQDSIYGTYLSSINTHNLGNDFNVVLEPLFYAFLFLTFDYIVLMISFYY